ncbi:MAG: GatB/YqeY domain-containing protein, partial [Candidatus Marinimicrobia bacterium]|nr:GatB/YqeY domain-containing protein [Candidatus Neomarinimicrobiota bacterium]
SDELKVIRSLVKQHKESIEAYTGGGRQDLVDLEQAAREHLETYLPRMLSEKEVRALVTEVITETGATGMSEIGKVMPQVMQRSAGLADGKLAQAIVLELLS